MLSLGLAVLIGGIVTVLCLGLFAALVLLGVKRYLSTSDETTQNAANKENKIESGIIVDEKQEMEWDNSGLNITVNPIDNIYVGQTRRVSVRDLEIDYSDGLSSCFDSSDEETDPATASSAKCKELEWDDSTLTI